MSIVIIMKSTYLVVFQYSIHSVDGTYFQYGMPIVDVKIPGSLSIPIIVTTIQRQRNKYIGYDDEYDELSNGGHP